MKAPAKELVPFLIDETCDACLSGKMRPTGQALMSIPVQYPHNCTECGHQESYHKTFPYIEHFPKNEEPKRKIVLSPTSIELLMHFYRHSTPLSIDPDTILFNDAISALLKYGLIEMEKMADAKVTDKGRKVIRRLTSTDISDLC